MPRKWQQGLDRTPRGSTHFGHVIVQARQDGRNRTIRSQGHYPANRSFTHVTRTVGQEDPQLFDGFASIGLPYRIVRQMPAFGPAKQGSKQVHAADSANTTSAYVVSTMNVMNSRKQVRHNAP